jgi:large subunit ribosomal protein L7/L12
VTKDYWGTRLIIKKIKDMSDEKKEAQVPEKFKALVEQIEKLSVLDLAELVKVLEEKFGVSAAAPVMAVVAGAPVAGGAPVDEQSTFNVEITEGGANKIGVIKVVRELTQIGLKDAKDLVDGAPKVVKEGVGKAEAEEMKKKLEAAGAKVTLK